MNTKLITASALTGLILTGGVAGMVTAQSAAEATGLTEEQVIAIALEEVPGDVTEVELDTHRGKQVYELEVMSTEGEEVEMYIAAENGDILKVSADGEDCKKGDRGDDGEDA